MIKSLSNIWLVLIVVFVIASCNIINPTEPVPAYLNIDNIVLSTNPSLQGSSSNKIKDAWVYIDNNPVGVYELGATFPVLETGVHKLSYQAGVLQNGINATHIAYPFYQYIVKDITLKAGEITYITNDTTTYYTGNEFPLNDGFEGLMNFERGDNSDTVLIFENDPAKVFEGTKCGVITLDTGQYVFEVKSQEIQLPKSGSNVYLEMNYKNNIPFQVVLQAEDALGTKIKNSVITLNTMNTWNKIYIELSPTIFLTPNANNFRLLFGTTRTNVSTKGELYFDNIKIVNN